MNEHDYNIAVNKGYEAGKREMQLQDVLREIEVHSQNMAQWKDMYFHKRFDMRYDYAVDNKVYRFDDNTYTESELQLAEWAILCEHKGRLLRLAESLYPNKTICTEIGYELYCYIRREMMVIDRFRGCMGLNEDTRMILLPHFTRYYAISEMDMDSVAVTLFDGMPVFQHKTRRIVIQWIQIKDQYAYRVDYDYDVQSNTLFIRNR